MFQSKAYEHSFERPTGIERLQHAVSWLLGPEPISERRPGHLWPRWIFLRALGLIYFSAFYSLLFQAEGLVGTKVFFPPGTIFRRSHRQFRECCDSGTPRPCCGAVPAIRCWWQFAGSD